MSTYLLELGLEEIPARFMTNFLHELQVKTEEGLKKERITFDSVKTLGTYRRLTVIVDGIATQQADLEEELKGPPLKIAKDDQGAWLPPAIGFAKRLGISPDELTEVEEKGAIFLAGKKFEKGQPTESILGELMAGIVSSLSLPIAMRWGDQDVPFFRALHWIVSVLDKQVIPMTLFGIEAANVSRGHRFLTDSADAKYIASGCEVKITEPNAYETLLNEAYVIVDEKQRRSLIQEQLLKHLDAKDIDEALLAEVTHLVEWPSPMKGTFDASYLDLPPAVLVTCMQKHQKYFPIFKKGELLNGFVVVADNVTADNKARILQGNEGVLRARLDDVRFFWDEDLKRSLDHFASGLDKVVFQKGLGSLADKVARHNVLADYFMTAIGTESDAPLIARANAICKADLLSQMVFEHPNLQGAMGALYARKQGEDAKVCRAIEEHYWPRFPGDSLPTESVGLILSLADKLDTVVACFYNKLIPTGSQDPWGVRRAINGILAILRSLDQSVDLKQAIDLAYQNFGEERNREKLTEFLNQRIRTFLIEMDFPYDIVDAVLDDAMSDLLSAIGRAKALTAARQAQKDAFVGMVDTAVRVGRLSSKADGQVTVDLNLFELPVEKSAWEAVNALAEATEGIDDQLQRLMALTSPLSDYFDQVLVMAEDKKVKANRLAFLGVTHSYYARVGDFEKIVV